MSIIVALWHFNSFRKTAFSFPKNKLFFTIRSGLAETKTRACASSLLDVNTNVVKDVLLYKNENTRQIKFLNYFSIVQFFFWNYLAHTVFFTLKDIPVAETNEDTPWYSKINLGTNAVKYSLTGLCLLIGNGVLCVAYFFSSRSLKYIILKKGGQRLDLITYVPYTAKESLLNVSVNQISANGHRTNARVTIPLKVKGKSLFYLIDMQGKFGNLRLFDATVGLNRKLN